jgi:iron complex outermembrane receptor protein
LSILNMKKKLLLSLVLSTLSAYAAADGQIELNPVVVTATKSAVNSFDVPVSIDVVDQSNIQDAQLGMTLSESLIRVPGVTAQSRSQFAQDPQISTRGYGSRSIFGVNGVRLLLDGIPLTMPDGIGQPGNVDLDTLKSIEVMRGPFSSMYGNASGGVIAMLTQDPPQTPQVSVGFLSGSYGTTKETAQATGTVDGVGYLLNESVFDTDGYREHSAAHKQQSTAELKFDLGTDTHVTILANYMKLSAEDPLGLRGPGSGTVLPTNKWAYVPSIQTDPQAAPSAALGANTRVNRENTQAGVHLEHLIDDDNSLNVVAYAGHRNNSQFLSTSVTPTGSTIWAGRDSSISRDFWGVDLSWAHKGEVLGKNYQVVSGIAYGNQSDDRLDINAANGVVTAVGLAAPNRDERDTASNFDEYVQGQLAIAENVDLHAGIRNTHTMLDVAPNLAGSKIGAGSLNFSDTTPVVGAVWKVRPEVDLYANYGRGFQTPNLIQIAYANSSGGGPNLNLSGSGSDNFEAGVKTFLSENTRLNFALFRILTHNEISLKGDASSYAVYWNLPVSTTRDGMELSVESTLPHNFGLYGAYTYLDARYDGAFQEAISSSGSQQSFSVNSGNTLPGTYKNQLYGEVSWKYPEFGFSTALEGRVNSKVFANDANSAVAPGYAIVNLRAGFQQSITHWQFSEYARIENLMDRNYISAVRVNDLNGEFYEAGATRNYLVGVSAAYRF